MTCHLTFAALAFLLTAATFWDPSARSIPQPAFEPAHHDGAHVGAPGRGFASAFGSSAHLRNLLY